MRQERVLTVSIKFTDSVSQQNHCLRFNLKNTRRGIHTEERGSVRGSFHKRLHIVLEGGTG